MIEGYVSGPHHGLTGSDPVYGGEVPSSDLFVQRPDKLEVSPPEIGSTSEYVTPVGICIFHPSTRWSMGVTDTVIGREFITLRVGHTCSLYIRRKRS